MKSRRHHNNNGLRSIKNGTVARQLKRIARKLGIPYGKSDSIWTKVQQKDKTV